MITSWNRTGAVVILGGCQSDAGLSDRSGDDTWGLVEGVWGGFGAVQKGEQHIDQKYSSKIPMCNAGTFSLHNR